jgi:hypothetical protein
MPCAARRASSSGKASPTLLCFGENADVAEEEEEEEEDEDEDEEEDEDEDEEEDEEEALCGTLDPGNSSKRFLRSNIRHMSFGDCPARRHNRAPASPTRGDGDPGGVLLLLLGLRGPGAWPMTIPAPNARGGLSAAVAGGVRPAGGSSPSPATAAWLNASVMLDIQSSEAR